MRQRISIHIFFLFAVVAWSVAWCVVPRPSKAQSGVLIPSSASDKPDPKVLSLEVMKVDIRIDNQHARVQVLQIFDNATPQTLEGKYLFALPLSASISDFAVWDGDLRIPGVMMEKRRANEIYTQIKQQEVDPGLLQADDEHGGTSAFSAKVFPIPPYGTKRLEMEYCETLPVEGLTSHFLFPLKASFGDPQACGEFTLRLVVTNDNPISAPEFHAGYPMRAVKTTPNEVEYEFTARNVTFKEDFSFDYRINIPESTLSWIAYRAPEQVSAYDLRDPATAVRDPDGYFEARALFNEKAKAPSDAPPPPKNVIFLFDMSLSMHGEKLERTFEAVDFMLHGLTPRDRFNLLLFNTDVNQFESRPLAGTPENVERALDFLKGSMLAGGTNLKKALLAASKAAEALPAGEKSVVWLTDANATLGTVALPSIIDAIAPEIGAAPKVRLFVLAVGSDAARSLPEELAEKCRGYCLRINETENATTQFKLFFDKIGTPTIDGITFETDSEANFRHVYPSADFSFDGSSASFVGRYKKPSPRVSVGVRARQGTNSIRAGREVSLPELDDVHDHLPRVWAKARVDALLREMDLNGEREDHIAEIIRLSQKYKFVTPYTAFIAAPRALLRPRLIQPGDPVIRVKTDPSVVSVFAVLPFGETLPLAFLPEEGVWEGRFLAPTWLPDGSYRCRLLLTDKNGNGFQEEKSFVIDSRPPTLKAEVESRNAKAGEPLLLKVRADRDVMRLVAKMYGAQPVELRWSDKDKASVGTLRVPAGIASGKYVVTVTAEDFAHNQASAEIEIEVFGR